MSNLLKCGGFGWLVRLYMTEQFHLEYHCETSVDEDQKPCISLIFTSIVMIDYLQAEVVYLKCGIVFFPLIYASVLENCNEGTKVASETTEESYTLYIKTFVSGCIESVFFLNFSSAIKGPFIAGKEKICTRGALSWGQGGSGVRDMAPPLLENLRAKFSETSFPHFKTYFTQISRPYIQLCENRIGSDHNLCFFFKYFFNFSKPSGRCYFTGYRLIRRTLSECKEVNFSPVPTCFPNRAALSLLGLSLVISNRKQLWATVFLFLQECTC